MLYDVDDDLRKMCESGRIEDAVSFFELVHKGGLNLTPKNYAFLLQECAKLKALDEGKKIHALLCTSDMKVDVFLMNNLLSMYTKCGCLREARVIFDAMATSRDVVTWTTLITGYAEQMDGNEALRCFEQMQHEGVFADALTFASCLKACGSVGAFEKGKEIHAEVVREGLLEKDILVGTTLVDMYAKCGTLAKAQEVFDHLRRRNVVSWSALIAGYVQHGHNEEALNCVRWMQREALSPNAVTFVSILKACGSIGAAGKGKEVHAEILREGLLDKNILVGNALVDMYAKCNMPLRAHDVFDSLPAHNVVSWTSLIAGYAQHEHGHEATNCFEQMQNEGFLPNAVTFVCILKACGSIGAGSRGKEIHSMLARNEILKDNVLVGNALVDMYAKCGIPAKAQQVFDELTVRDAFSWNALINGYAQLGKDDVVISLFDKMISEQVQPDVVTFTLILNACSHSGLLDKGKMCFKMIRSGFGIVPTSEHHTCMVDLFGRAGHLDEAAAIIKLMPTFDFPPIWTTLLSSCQKLGDIEVGELAFEHAIQLNENHTAAYVCMRNMYAAETNNCSWSM